MTKICNLIGIKTIQLSSAIGKKGKLFACEKRVGRLNSLKSHLSQNYCDSKNSK